LLSAAVFEARGRVPFTSDQAVVGIMASDIREHGAHPVFYYGAEYAGTLEPHYVALVFALVGPSVTAFRAAMALLLALVVVAVHGGTRAAFGERAALFAGLYLALGPSYFFYKGLTSDGAYASLLLLSAVCLWFIVAIEARFARGLEAAWPLAGLGAALGLAWFVHSPAAFLGPVVLVGALAGTTRRWLAVRNLALLGGTFFVGSAPWWARNLGTGFASLRSSEMAPAHGGHLAQQVLTLFSQGWSLLLGGQSVWAWVPTFPGAVAVALGLFVLLAGFGVWYGLRGPDPRSRHGAWVFVAAVFSLSLLCLTVSRTDFREPRYLFAAYAGIAPLVGGLASALWPRRIAGAALLATVLALNLGSEQRAPVMKHADPALGFFGETDLTSVLSELKVLGIRSLYASYWAAYRITFLSGGTIAASPLGSETNGIARIESLKVLVNADPSPAFLLRDADLQTFRTFLAKHGFARRRRATSGFVLFTDVAPQALEIVRRCGCIPTIVGPGEVVLEDPRGPERVVAGAVATYRVRVRNGSPHPLSDNVHLSYHWRRADGSFAVWDGARAPSPWPAGVEVDVAIEVRADVAPGEYDLVFDLVDEGASWFESMGAPPPSRHVVVAPR